MTIVQMKFTFFNLLLFLLLLIACTEKQEKRTNSTQVPVAARPWETAISAEEFYNICAEIDSFQVKEKYLLPGNIEKKITEMVIQRNANLLGIRLGDGRSLNLRDSISPITRKIEVDFFFETYLPNTAQYQVAKSMTNDFETYLIDFRTGKITVAEGIPKESPDSTKIITYNGDLEIYQTPNGFQLFVASDSGLVLNTHWTHSYYSPQQVCWESDSTILVRAILADDLLYPTSTQQYKQSYFRIHVFNMPFLKEQKL